MTEVSMKEKNGEHPFGDAGQLISLGIFLVFWIGDSFFLRQSTFLSDYVPLYVRLSFLGLTIITALCLFRSGHVVVSHEQRPNSVVATGAFRYVRHPLYLASILIYIGLVVSTVSLFSLVLLLGIFIFHNYIASYEEKLLDEKFGEEYREYKSKTGKWLPKIGKVG
jgi:protein-S-isoprenylcysteine O-methyltransferase Ste14